METVATGWNSSGEEKEPFPQSTHYSGLTHPTGRLESRFFVDDGCWKDAPVLTGQTCFEPLPDVRNILVTGGEGFIASWLVRHLVTKYADSYNVVCFDKLDYCSSLNNSRMLEGRANFRFFHGDITKESDVLKCLEMYQIDTIFHLAAQSHVDLSFGNSFTFTHNNVVGTHVLLESARVMKTIKRFYHISTDEVFSHVTTQKGESGTDTMRRCMERFQKGRQSCTRTVHCIPRIPTPQVRLVPR